MITQTLTHAHISEIDKKCAGGRRQMWPRVSPCASRWEIKTLNRDEFWYSHVLTGWHSWSQRHTYKKEKKKG